MKLRHRALVVLLLMTALGGLSAHAAITGDQRSPYPDAATLATDYESYVGERVLLFGAVTERTDTEISIRSHARGVSLTLRVTNVTADVAPGAIVQVYGTIKQGRVLTSERLVVVNDGPGAKRYKYGASALGALGFLIVFFRHWRIETDGWKLEVRDG